MKCIFIPFLLVIIFGVMGDLVFAQSLDQGMTEIATSISKQLADKGYKNVAVIEFLNLQGQPTELGRLLSDHLAIEIVLNGKVSVMDRANISSILAEHRLTEEGLVNPSNAKKLGEFAGVDAILIGNIAAFDEKFTLMVRAISTSSSAVEAGGRVTFPATKETQQFFNRKIYGNTSILNSTTEISSSNSTMKFEDSDEIVSENIGPLRIVLKSILPIKSNDGRNLSTIRCIFELINLETQLPIIVAMNAENANFPSQSSGITLRSSLVDDRGQVWNLLQPALGGLGFVRAGVYGRRGPSGQIAAHNPSDIVKLLKLRDELGRDVDDPSDGYIAIYDKRFVPYKGNKFISGSPSMINPGQSINVIMDFTSRADNSNYPKFVQLTGDLIIGVVNNNRTTYSQQTLLLNRINLLSEQ